jgi:hypothetical protein
MPWIGFRLMHAGQSELNTNFAPLLKIEFQAKDQGIRSSAIV